MKSALLAAKNGMPYVFGAFMSDQDGRAIEVKHFSYLFPITMVLVVHQVVVTHLLYNIRDLQEIAPPRTLIILLTVLVKPTLVQIE